jgi:hypothetical protein
MRRHVSAHACAASFRLAWSARIVGIRHVMGILLVALVWASRLVRELVVPSRAPETWWPDGEA